MSAFGNSAICPGSTKDSTDTAVFNFLPESCQAVKMCTCERESKVADRHKNRATVFISNLASHLDSGFFSNPAHCSYRLNWPSERVLVQMKYYWQFWIFLPLPESFALRLSSDRVGFPFEERCVFIYINHSYFLFLLPRFSHDFNEWDYVSQIILSQLILCYSSVIHFRSDTVYCKLFSTYMLHFLWEGLLAKDRRANLVFVSMKMHITYFIYFFLHIFLQKKLFVKCTSCILQILFSEPQCIYFY